MIDIKSEKFYKFSVREIEGGPYDIKILHPKSKTTEDILSEAAQLYYWGLGGWQQAWPLTFDLQTMQGHKIATASIFVLAGITTLRQDNCFDVVELEGV